MIIKSMDSIKEELAAGQRFLIGRELKRMKSRVHGEGDSVYYLNFYFGSSKILG
jgi:hypothetical protein